MSRRTHTMKVDVEVVLDQPIEPQEWAIRHKVLQDALNLAVSDLNDCMCNPGSYSADWYIKKAAENLTTKVKRTRGSRG